MIRSLVASIITILLALNCSSLSYGQNDAALAQYQKIFVKQQNKGIDKLLEQFNQDEGMYKADSSVSFANYLSPEKNHILVTISRTSRDMLDKWLLIVMNTRTFAVERVFDFLRATGIEKIQWLNEDRFILLSRRNNLAGPPGELFLVNARASEARKIDDYVWKYYLDFDTQEAVFYEKSLEEDKLYDKREIISCNLANLQKTKVFEVLHPVTQFGKLGPMESEGSFFGFEVQTYGETFEPDIAKWWFDTMTEKAFEKKDTKE